MTAGVRDGMASGGSGIYMGFMGVKVITKGNKGICLIGLRYIIK